jgi:hypothetical protein
MSVPNRSKNGIDDSLSHAPRWVRQSPEQSTSTHASSTAPLITTGATPRITNAPPKASGIGGYNIDLPPPRSRPFAGDVDAKTYAVLPWRPRRTALTVNVCIGGAPPLRHGSRIKPEC